LLQAGAGAGMIPGLQDILTMTMKLLMPPVMDPFMEKVNDHFSNTESQELAGDINAATPVDSATMAEPQIRTNLVALLPDAVAYATRSVAPSVVASRATAEGLETITATVPGAAADRAGRSLLRSLPRRLSSTLGSLLERQLGVSLVPLLSVSIPRALVPAVTAALRLGGLPAADGSGRPLADPEPWCRACYRQPNGSDVRPAGDAGTSEWEGCAFCTPSYRVALARYYGAYYSQYYGLYYARYYGVKAMLALEQVQHAPLDPGAVKAARKENEAGKATGPSGRPVTPFGTPQAPVL